MKLFKSIKLYYLLLLLVPILSTGSNLYARHGDGGGGHFSGFSGRGHSFDGGRNFSHRDYDRHWDRWDNNNWNGGFYVGLPYGSVGTYGYYNDNPYNDLYYDQYYYYDY